MDIFENYWSSPRSCVTVINLHGPQNYSCWDTRRQRSYSCNLDGVEQRLCSIVWQHLQVCVSGGTRLSIKERCDKSFILCTTHFFYLSTVPVTSPRFFHVLSFNMLHETWRNITSHNNSGDRPDLWLPTSLQPSLAGQGSGAKAINQTQTIHVGGTQLHCSKNEKKTHSETDGRLKATTSITGWRLHKASRRKQTRR